MCEKYGGKNIVTVYTKNCVEIKGRIINNSKIERAIHIRTYHGCDIYIPFSLIKEIK